jgi:DNA replication protein
MRQTPAAGAFSGFRAGSRATAVPNAFFATLLPQIDGPAELIISCYIFFALGRQRGFPRVVSERSLAAEAPLMRTLARLAGDPAAALRQGLDAAVARGTLLCVQQPADANAGPFYLLNTDSARRLLERSATVVLSAQQPEQEEAVEQEPGKIYALYEENIGPIAPLLFDELSEAAVLYPASWIEAAFREAIARNKRNWRYIARILERWKLEGPNYETSGGPAAAGVGSGGRSLAGRYRHLVHRAPDS